MSFGGGPGADQTAELWGLMGGERAGLTSPGSSGSTAPTKSWIQSVQVDPEHKKRETDVVKYLFYYFYFYLYVVGGSFCVCAYTKNVKGSSEYIPDAMKNAMAWIMKTITVS